MAAESFQSVDVADVGSEMSRLHELVVRNLGRVEITGADGRTSIVISKTELESLERALELLSESEEVRELSEAVSQLAQDLVTT